MPEGHEYPGRTRMQLPPTKTGCTSSGWLPEGCVRCESGQKTVLFVTGRCSHNCFYCPISEKKRGIDAVYANEKLVSEDADVLHECRSIDALGTGITGGDPLLVPDRTLHYIGLLKDEFGEGHHIHLYAYDFEDEGLVGSLAGAGLDEIRFHIFPYHWDKAEGHHIMRLVERAQATEMRVGFEVPVLPDMGRELSHLAEVLDLTGVEFLNLNEFEVSDTNWEALHARGYEPAGDFTNAVAGSEETAMKLLEEADCDMLLHFCSAGFKDGVQLRNRLKRRAKNTKRPYDLVTEDGTFIRGVIEAGDPNVVLRDLREKYEIPSDLIAIDDEKGRVEVAAWILEEIAHRLPHACFIVEEYPTADRLEVERRPL